MHHTLQVHHARHEQTGPAGWVIAGEDVPGELASFLRADVAHWRHVAEIPRLTSEVRHAMLRSHFTVVLASVSFLACVADAKYMFRWLSGFAPAQTRDACNTHLDSNTGQRKHCPVGPL